MNMTREEILASMPRVSVVYELPTTVWIVFYVISILCAFFCGFGSGRHCAESKFMKTATNAGVGTTFTDAQGATKFQFIKLTETK